MSEHSVIPSLSDLIAAIQPDSIISRTFHRDEQVKAVLFGFDAGQYLSEHTASQAAIIQILQGEATLTLNDETHEVGPGAWIHMPPRCKHSVLAKTPLIMLLLLLGEAGS